MFSRQEKILLATLGAINFSHIVDFMIMMPLGPQLMRVFGIDPHRFGLLVSCYTLAAGVSGFVVSFVIDRMDRKSALLFFFFGFSLGTIACAVSRNYSLLLAARTLTGAFGGVLSSVVLAIVSDAISIERRGTAMGVIFGAFSVASVAGLPFSLFLASQYDWHAPFMFLGIVTLFLTIYIALKFPRMRSHLKGPHTAADRKAFSALKQIVSNPTQLAALAFTFTLLFGQFTVIPFLSPSFVANGGLSETQLPLVYLCGGIVSMFASPLFGRLSDRYGKKRLFVVGAIASLLPIVLITRLGPSPVAIILLESSLFFLVMSGRMVPAMALISSVPHPRHRGSFMSINSSVQQLAMALGSYVAGLIVVRTAAGQLDHYSTVGWIAVLCTCFALIIIRFVRSTEA